MFSHWLGISQLFAALTRCSHCGWWITPLCLLSLLSLPILLDFLQAFFSSASAELDKYMLGLCFINMYILWAVLYAFLNILWSGIKKENIVKLQNIWCYASVRTFDFSRMLFLLLLRKVFSLNAIFFSFSCMNLMAFLTKFILCDCMHRLT